MRQKVDSKLETQICSVGRYSIVDTQNFIQDETTYRYVIRQRHDP